MTDNMNKRKRIGLTAAQIICGVMHYINPPWFVPYALMKGNEFPDKSLHPDSDSELWFNEMLDYANENGVTDREILWGAAAAMVNTLLKFNAFPDEVIRFFKLEDPAKFVEQQRDSWLDLPDVEKQEWVAEATRAKLKQAINE